MRSTCVPCGRQSATRSRFRGGCLNGGDSLYENYANTYISDAHWHNGGQCTQASAYTYRGNLLAAQAAPAGRRVARAILGRGDTIRQAMNRILWIKDKGVYAEWKDTQGEKLLHGEPELGSIYLPIDCDVADAFQTYQMLRFTEWGLPNHRLDERGPQPFDGYIARADLRVPPADASSRDQEFQLAPDYHIRLRMQPRRTYGYGAGVLQAWSE